MDAALRLRVHSALASAASAPLQRLASALQPADGAPLPCWGDLADLVRGTISTDDDRIALWLTLVEAADARTLIAFLDLQRDRPNVLRAIVGEVARLPFTVQCALVTMPETAALVSPSLPGLCAAARELVSAPEERRARDRAVYEAHMSSILAQRATSLPTPSTSRNPEVPEANVSGGSS